MKTMAADETLEAVKAEKQDIFQSFVSLTKTHEDVFRKWRAEKARADVLQLRCKRLEAVVRDAVNGGCIWKKGADLVRAEDLLGPHEDY